MTEEWARSGQLANFPSCDVGCNLNLTANRIYFGFAKQHSGSVNALSQAMMQETLMYIWFHKSKVLIKRIPDIFICFSIRNNLQHPDEKCGAGVQV